jgi:surfactin synthase thioesterase subunit
VTRQAVVRPKSWLLRRPQTDAPTRLFLLPYSGMGASMYARWPTLMGDTEICLVQLPGRENRLREPHFGGYGELAPVLAEQLRPYLDRPFGFFGHCGGVLPAVATALHLARNGMPTPTHTFVSSQVAPHRGPYGKFFDMTDEELTAELNRLYVAMGGSNPHPELIAMNLGVLKADLAASSAYKLPGPAPLPGNLHCIGWSSDVDVPPSLMTEWDAYVPPERYSFTVLDGEHYSFLNAPQPLMDLLGRRMSLIARELS